MCALQDMDYEAVLILATLRESQAERLQQNPPPTAIRGPGSGPALGQSPAVAGGRTPQIPGDTPAQRSSPAAAGTSAKRQMITSSGRHEPPPTTGLPPRRPSRFAMESAQRPAPPSAGHILSPSHCLFLHQDGLVPMLGLHILSASKRAPPGFCCIMAKHASAWFIEFRTTGLPPQRPSRFAMVSVQRPAPPSLGQIMYPADLHLTDCSCLDWVWAGPTLGPHTLRASQWEFCQNLAASWKNMRQPGSLSPELDGARCVSALLH